MVAFVGSLLIVASLMRRQSSSGTPSAGPSARPSPGARPWSPATYVFFLMFWVYGVVPHQWLT